MHQKVTFNKSSNSNFNKTTNLSTFSLARINNRIMRSILLLSFIFLLAGCSEPKIEVVRAFYFWENDAGILSTGNKEALDSLQIEKLYIKVFEVDRIDGKCEPYAKSILDLRLPKSSSVQELIPCVYIQNKVFIESSREELDELAENLAHLAKKYITVEIPGSTDKYIYDELQIDCDWTEASKGNYFYFLKKVKAESNKIISCTLRLYPYKFNDKMGVPPCDKAMLMCYNLLNPLKNDTKNTILDVDEMSKYLDTEIDYPIHIDVALPVYSWIQVYENKRFKGVIHNANRDLSSFMSPTENLWYTMEKDTVVGGIYMRKGDRIKIEQVTKEQIDLAIDLIKKSGVLKDKAVVSFFSLESNELNYYGYETLDHFYSSF
ncbi:MAG: hypothetical protein ACI837_000603 [Crocinitomicaceae bacterium]|jgi:hypothetical protein